MSAEPQAELVELGSPQVFVSKTANGDVKAVKQTVALTQDDCYSVQGTVALKAVTYDKLNQIAGLSTVNPPQIIDAIDGVQPNPYIKRNSKGLIESVTIRKMAIGYSPIGNLAIVDQTVQYSLNTYFIQDILSQMKKDKNCAKRVKESGISDEDKKNSIFVPEYYEPFTGEAVGLLLDIRTEGARKIFKNHDERQQHAERRAETICRRNCLKRHPAIAVTNVTMRQGRALVTVYGFKNDMDKNELLKTVDKITYGKNVENAVIEADNIVANNEDDIAASQDISMDPSSQMSEIVEAAEVDVEDNKKTVVIDNIRRCQTKMSNKAYGELYKQVFGSSRPSLEECELTELLKLEILAVCEARKESK
jgi:hypothetical protein